MRRMIEPSFGKMPEPVHERAMPDPRDIGAPLHFLVQALQRIRIRYDSGGAS